MMALLPLTFVDSEERVGYPTRFPAARAAAIVDIVRQKQVVARRVELAHAAWVVQGWLQGRIAGEPQPPLVGTRLLRFPTDEQACGALTMLAAHPASLAGDPAAVPHRWLLAWLARLLVQALLDP